MEDVVKNIRYFLSVVKRATGNERSSNPASKSPSSQKPRKPNSMRSAPLLLTAVQYIPLSELCLAHDKGPAFV